MKKHWVIGETYCHKYESFEEAEKAAKRRATDDKEDTGIYEVVAVARFPVPDVTVDKIKG